MKSSHLLLLQEGKSLWNLYETPAQGQSKEAFEDMVSNFVKMKLEDGDHKDLVATIMNIADVNNDAKVNI